MIRSHVGRLGREAFIDQFRAILHWAVHDPFWTTLRHDGSPTDQWSPKITSILDIGKWDERVDVAAAAVANERILEASASESDEETKLANEELRRVLDNEAEKIRRRDEAAGGDSNALLAADDASTDPELVAVEEAAEQVTRNSEKGATP